MSTKRITAINQEIQRELSEHLRTVKDPRVQDCLISITRVETTPDLRWAKIYVSFLQSERAAEGMKGLRSASGYMRRGLGEGLNLRYTPQLQWELDESITYGAHMLELIHSLNVESDEADDR